MTPSDRLILGLAALLLTVGSASALDVRTDLATSPSSTEPCPGRPGFVRPVGSRTCTRLSARVRGDAQLRADRRGAAATPVASGRFAIDTRTDTDLGEVRTFVRAGNGRR